MQANTRKQVEAHGWSKSLDDDNFLEALEEMIRFGSIRTAVRKA